MRKLRELIEGATYHVTSRINGYNQAFHEKAAQKLMFLVIKEAKKKYGFKLHNFCIMPNHIHLLITPAKNTNLSRIMQWIKTKSAKLWNRKYNSRGHLWGERFFSRIIKDSNDFLTVSNYIEQNPVIAGLTHYPHEWRYSGAFYIWNDIEGFIDHGCQSP